MVEATGWLVQGRQRFSWIDGVTKGLGQLRRMTVGAARQHGKDRKNWRTLVNT